MKTSGVSQWSLDAAYEMEGVHRAFTPVMYEQTLFISHKCAVDIEVYFMQRTHGTFNPERRAVNWLLLVL